MSKIFKASELLGAIVEQGNEPCIIEDIDNAKAWSETINGGNAEEITDAWKLARIAQLLELSERDTLRRAFAFVSGSAGHVALAEDWETAPSLEEYAYKEGLELVSTCDNANGYPSGIRHAITGFASFEEAAKAAEKCGGEIIEISRREGRDLWTREGWISGHFEFSSEQFGDDYAVYDDAASYWEDQREALADRISEGLELDELAKLVSEAQDTRDRLEDLNEGECALCRNDEGIYVHVKDLDSMDYEFDGIRHTVAVIERRGR